MCSLVSFLPLFPSLALIVFHCRNTFQSICRHSRTQQEGCDKRLCEGALALPLLSSIPCQNNPAMLGLLLSSPTMIPSKISRSEMWASLQIINYSGQHRGENAFTGSTGIIYVFISIHISPALPAGCGEALAGWLWGPHPAVDLNESPPL